LVADRDTNGLESLFIRVARAISQGVNLIARLGRVSSETRLLRLRRISQFDPPHFVLGCFNVETWVWWAHVDRFDDPLEFTEFFLGPIPAMMAPGEIAK